jgi:Protein of unknown function
MAPDLIDQAILMCCKPRFLKVARIITDVAKALQMPLPMAERLYIDEAPEEPTEVDFIADRIKALVKAGKLESEGDLDRWRFSEIRLPKSEPAT